ncbi:MAG: Fpg/Nei family DNA glycosylase [Woeseiaceae bacterium]
MPELPDIDVYIETLATRIIGHTLTRIRVSKPFLVRSFDPPLEAAHDKKVVALKRIGKRIAIGLEDEHWLVLHLMIAGRLQWREDPVRIGGKHQLAAFDFSSGTLLLTEAGTRKRASLYLVCGLDGLNEHDPGGIEPLECDIASFSHQLLSENRTLKRALTNPRMFSGIGNAYSDEILHAARLSPLKLTSRLDDDERDRLFAATQSTLIDARARLRTSAGGDVPAKVTAFHEEMAVHGKFGKPCPDCGTSIARIRYKRNETNYCPACQTGGRMLADRSLSRLLKDDWPDAL